MRRALRLVVGASFAALVLVPAQAAEARPCPAGTTAQRLDVGPFGVGYCVPQGCDPDACEVQPVRE